MTQVQKRISMTITVLMLVLLVGGITPISAQNADFSRLAIIATNPDQFPDVSLSVRIQDDKGLAVQGLTAEHFSVDEAQINFSVTATETPLNVVFIVDLSEMNTEELTGIEAVLQSIASNYQRSEDNFQIITIQGGAVQTVQSSLSAFAQHLQYSGFASQDTYSEATALANSLLHDALNRHENAQIVFVAAYTPQTIEPPTTTVPIHTIHVQSSQVQRGGAFGTLTTGHYLRYQGNQDRLRDYLDWVFANNRNAYNLTYRSQNGTSAARNVSVSARLNGQTLTDRFEYQVALQPPLVAVRLASGNEIIRNAVTAEGPDQIAGGQNWDKYQEDLTVEVSFPDGYPRAITAGELIVEQIALARIEQPGERFTLSWDLSAYTYEGGRVFDVSAAAADEFGLVGTSPVQSVTIATNIPEGIAVQDPCLNPDGTRVNTPVCLTVDNAEIAIGTLIALTIGLAALLGVVVWQRRQLTTLAAGVASQAVGTVVKVGHTIVEAGSQLGTIIEKSILGRSPGSSSPIGGYATFHIVEGPGAGSDVEMRSDIIVFGRSTDAGVDHVFSLPNVSSKHCSVRYYPDERAFKIVDHRSANKTRVNGIAIEPEMPEVLQPGAEIQLARQNRVLMTFNPAPDRITSRRGGPASHGETFFEDRNETLVDADAPNAGSANNGNNFTPAAYDLDPDDDYEQLDRAHTQIRTSQAGLQPAPERNFARNLPQQPNDNGTPENEGDW